MLAWASFGSLESGSSSQRPLGKPPRHIHLEFLTCVSTNQSTSRSAAELDELFERKIKAWRFKKTETATQLLVKSEQEAQQS